MGWRCPGHRLVECSRIQWMTHTTPEDATFSSAKEHMETVPFRPFPDVKCPKFLSTSETRVADVHLGTHPNKTTFPGTGGRSNS